MRSRMSQLNGTRQDPATSRQVVQMRRVTVQIIQKQGQDTSARAGAKTVRRKDLVTSEASTWCADHKCNAPPDMLTSQSKRACLRREVPTDHEAHRRSSGGCRRAGVSISARRASVGDAGGRSRTREARSYRRSSPQRPDVSKTATCTKTDQSSKPRAARE